MVEGDKIVICNVRLQISLTALAAILNKSIDEVEYLWRENKLELIVTDAMQRSEIQLSDLVSESPFKLENPGYKPGESH
jgi:hypothetical protein